MNKKYSAIIGIILIISLISVGYAVFTDNVTTTSAITTNDNIKHVDNADDFKLSEDKSLDNNMASGTISSPVLNTLVNVDLTGAFNQNEDYYSETESSNVTQSEESPAADVFIDYDDDYDGYACPAQKYPPYPGIDYSTFDPEDEEEF